LSKVGFVLPSGTVTFLFSDVVGSTQLWEMDGDAMKAAQQLHDETMLRVVSEAGGHVVKTLGDGAMAVFADSEAALAAAAQCQRGLAAETWQDLPRLWVRVGIHTGSAVASGGDYHGPAVNRCARLAEVAQGGQILVSEATAAVASLPDGLSLVPLGEHRLRDLGEAIGIFQLGGEGIDADFGPLRTLDHVDHNLPSQRTSFVGRNEELEWIRRSLATGRLVTLAGMGGVGKTRLAVQAAADEADRFPDGVRLVELAATTWATEVIGAVSDVVAPTRDDAAAADDPLRDLARRIGHRQALLVLDNCEQVVAECARIVDFFLDSCPRLSVLATSREPLTLDGEQVLLVEPLPVAESSGDMLSPAVRLFIERAASGLGGFTPDEENMEAVVSICQRVDGIPLAIELAAARVAHISPAEILDRLDDRMEVLTGRGRSRPERHRTLTALLDWSYELLAPVEQRLFRRLSVLVGPTTVSSIEGVLAAEDLPMAEVFDALSSLVDKSLVSTSERSGRSRYRLLDTVRRYAAFKLDEAGESSQLRRIHAEWYADRLAEHEKGSEELSQLLESEFDDILAALHWASGAGRVDLACRIAGSAWQRWEVRGHLMEGRQVLASLVDDPAAFSSPAYPAVVNGAAHLAFAAGDRQVAGQLHEDNLSRFVERGDRRGEGGTLNSLAVVALFDGRVDEAEALVSEALRLWEALGDDSGRAYALTTLGMVRGAQGDHEDASAALLSALALFRTGGYKRDAASVLNNLGNLAHDRGELNRAHRFYEGALNLHRELDDDRGIAMSLNNLSIISRERSNPDRAADFAEEALDVFRRTGDQHGMAAILNNLANLAEEQHQPHRSLELYGEAIEQFRRNGDSWGMATTLENLADVAARTGNAQLGWQALIDSAHVHLSARRGEQAALGLTRLSGLAAGLGFYDEALKLAGAADVLFDGKGTLLNPEFLGAVRGDLDDDAVSSALDAGRALEGEHLLAQLRALPVPELVVLEQESDSPDDGLTPREKEVAALIGRGLANSEIADQLFISERTVDSHVTHIRTKLGITSRTQLAVWAVQNLQTPSPEMS
jgi:predicted ATPase/class 3 adenylate cyclase/DNA-binding CsgD family transcriptional regulator